MSRNNVDLTYEDEDEDEYFDDDDELFDVYSDHSDHDDFDDKNNVVVETQKKEKRLKQADAELLLGLATQASTGIVLTDKSSQESSISSRNIDHSHDRRHLAAPQCSLHRSKDDNDNRNDEKQSQRHSKLKLKISKKRASQSSSTEESTANNTTMKLNNNSSAHTTSQSSSSSTPVKRKKKRKVAPKNESPTTPSNQVSLNSPQKDNSNKLTATGSSIKSSQTNDEINVKVNIESNGISTPPLQRSPTPKSSEIKDMSNKTPPTKGTITPKSSENKSLASNSTPQSIRKKKKKTFQDQVYDHMWKSMKPMTLKSMAQTFRTSDTALHHLMLSLTDKGMVIEKKTKKKSIFWANTDYKNPSKNSSTEECTEVERQQAKEDLGKYSMIYNNLENQLSKLLKEATNEELVDKIRQSQQNLEKVQQSIQQTKERIDSHNKEKQSRKKLGTKFNTMRKEWKNRKEKCIDFCYNLSDAMEKKPKDIFKLIDIETDEDYNVKLPPLLQLDDQNSTKRVQQYRKR